MARIGSGGDVQVVIAALNKTKKGIDGAIGDINRLEKSSKRATSSMKRQLTAYKKQFTSFKGMLVTAGIVAMGRQMISTAADIEDAWIEVVKRTGLAGKELEDFKDKIRKMSLEMKGVKLGELQEIAAIGGQIGIANEDLIEFTRVIAMMGVATDLNAERASLGMAKLGNVLGEPVENYEKMGSVINELSNNSGAFSSEIVEMTKRMGAMGKNLGLTTPEIMAIAATMRDAGVEVEVGGTAWSKIFRKMLSDVEGFAKASGVPLKEFTKLVKDEPMEAIRALARGFAEMDKFQVTKSLEGLKLARQGTVESLLALVKMNIKHEKSIIRANEQYVSGTSLLNEYMAASKRLRAQMDQTSNQWKLFSEEMGTAVFPVLRDFLPLLSGIIRLLVLIPKGITETGKAIGNFFAKQSLLENPFEGWGGAFNEIAKDIGTIGKRLWPEDQDVTIHFKGEGSRVLPLSEKIAEMKALISGLEDPLNTTINFSSVRDSTELARLEAKSPYKAGAGGSSNEVGAIVEAYNQKLELLRVYNGSVLQEMVVQGKSEADIVAKYEELKQGYEEKTMEFKIHAAGLAFGVAANFMQNLFVATGSNNKKMFAMMQAFSIAQAAINTREGYTKALAQGGTAGFIGAAVVLAAGMAQVAEIAAMKPGGGNISAGGTASAPYHGGSTGASPVPQRLEASAKPTIVFKIENMHLLDENSVDLLRERIKDSIEKYDADWVTVEAT